MSGNYSPAPAVKTPALSSAGCSAAPGLTYVVLHLCVVLVHQLQQPQLNLGLVQEGLFVLDDLDGHQLLGLMIIGFYHLTGWGMSQSEELGGRGCGTEQGTILLWINISGCPCPPILGSGWRGASHTWPKEPLPMSESIS